MISSGAFALVAVLCWRARYLDLASPMLWYLAFHLLAWLIRPFVMLVTGDYGAASGIVTGSDDPLLLRTIGGTIVGLVALAFGYHLGMSSSAPRQVRLPGLFWSRRLTLLVALAFTAEGFYSGWVYWISHLRTARIEGEYVYVSAYVAQGYYYVGSAVLLLLFRFGRRPWVVALAVVSWVFGLMIGWQRWAVILNMLAVIIFEAIASPQRRALTKALLVASPLILTAFSMLGNNRSALRDWLYGQTEASHVVALASENCSPQWSTDLSAFDGALYRFAAYPNLVPYEGFGIYPIGWLSMAIPRVWWSGKPGLVLPDIEDPRFRIEKGVVPGIIGAFYANLGYPGVAIGMFAMGLALGALHLLYRTHRAELYVQYFHCVVVSLLPLVFRNGLYTAPQIYFFWLAPALILCGIATLTSRQARTTAREREHTA
jgi:hypothetical protein